MLLAAGKLLGGLKPPQEQSTNDAQDFQEPQVGSDGRISTSQRPIENGVLVWPFGSKLSMHVYLSTDPEGYVFRHEEPLPHFVWNDITFGDWNEARVIDLDVNFSEACPRIHVGIDARSNATTCRMCDTMDLCGRIFSWSRTTLLQIPTPRIITPF